VNPVAADVRSRTRFPLATLRLLTSAATIRRTPAGRAPTPERGLQAASPCVDTERQEQHGRSGRRTSKRRKRRAPPRPHRRLSRLWTPRERARSRLVIFRIGPLRARFGVPALAGQDARPPPEGGTPNSAPPRARTRLVSFEMGKKRRRKPMIIFQPGQKRLRSLVLNFDPMPKRPRWRLRGSEGGKKFPVRPMVEITPSPTAAPNANGVPSFSPGLRGTSYPGKQEEGIIHPNGVASRIAGAMQPRWGRRLLCGQPRVAPASQPWAE